MLKTFKLNTINLSTQIFNTDCQNHDGNAFSKNPASFNKRFKYNYKKSMHLPSSDKKSRKYTIDMGDLHTHEDIGRRGSEDGSNLMGGEQRQRLQRRRKTASHQTYINNFIFQGSKYTKKTLPSYPQPKNHSSSTNNNRTEQTENSPIANRQNGSRVKAMLDQGQRKQAGPEAADSQKNERANEKTQHRKNLSMNVIKQKEIGRASQYEKSRTSSKPKYTNSIIQSYKIKSIELANPLASKGSTGRKANTIDPSYYLDLANEDNLKEIYFQDIEKIQLQRVKYDTRRAFSHHHCKQRPQTSKLQPKLEDFEPQPWESEDRHDEIYAKDNISQI